MDAARAVFGETARYRPTQEWVTEIAGSILSPDFKRSDAEGDNINRLPTNDANDANDAVSLISLVRAADGQLQLNRRSGMTAEAKNIFTYAAMHLLSVLRNNSAAAQAEEIEGLTALSYRHHLENSSTLRDVYARVLRDQGLEVRIDGLIASVIDSGAIEAFDLLLSDLVEKLELYNKYCSDGIHGEAERQAKECLQVIDRLCQIVSPQSLSRNQTDDLCITDTPPEFEKVTLPSFGTGEMLLRDPTRKS